MATASACPEICPEPPRLQVISAELMRPSRRNMSGANGSCAILSPETRVRIPVAVLKALQIRTFCSLTRRGYSGICPEDLPNGPIQHPATHELRRVRGAFPGPIIRKPGPDVTGSKVPPVGLPPRGERHGCSAVRQRGRHVRLKKPGRRHTLSCRCTSQARDSACGMLG
jgi:hypothetical protein